MHSSAGKAWAHAFAMAPLASPMSRMVGAYGSPSGSSTNVHSVSLRWSVAALGIGGEGALPSHGQAHVSVPQVAHTPPPQRQPPSCRRAVATAPCAPQFEQSAFGSLGRSACAAVRREVRLALAAHVLPCGVVVVGPKMGERCGDGGLGAVVGEAVELADQVIDVAVRHARGRLVGVLGV